MNIEWEPYMYTAVRLIPRTNAVCNTPYSGSPDTGIDVSCVHWDSWSRVKNLLTQDVDGSSATPYSRNGQALKH
ncbi:hypothetical protein E2C01_065299 [Portunus trituberculatus]|uniref:Uncharacterized protein n=1 Tax=Portunus trituberculatus TaxID=210409 RepID=A0A5B7HIH0_PORTR|nr:hypothetical protein [Portunus trituberculatus]